MSKLGKILGLVVALLAITTAVLAVLIARQVKQARYRAQILATNLSKTASVLDSGSGVAEKANFRPAGDDNKESGSLGWLSAKTAGDLSASSNSYDTTAGLVVELADNVIQQRNTIIDKLIALSTTLDCPAAAKPKSDIMQDLNSYTKQESGTMSTDSLNAFEAHVASRVKRDKNIKDKINELLAQLGVTSRYKGDITSGGALSGADQEVLKEAATRFISLKSNYTALQQALQTVATDLQGTHVDGVTFGTSASDSTFRADGLDPKTGAALGALIAKIRTDMQTAQTQLQTIDPLKAEIKRLQQELADSQAEIQALKKRIQGVGELVAQVYADGGMQIGRPADAPILARFSDVPKDLCGSIVRLDAQFGYLVTNLHNGVIVKDAKFAVFRGGKFLGIVKILQVDDFNSMAIVVSGKASDMAVGDTLVLAEDALQDRELMEQ